MKLVIAGIDKTNGIGYNGTIPWDLPGDRRLFRNLTMNGIIVMGRKTWESLPVKPLPGRINVVITTHSLDEYPNVETYQSAEAFANAYYHRENVWVIGGAELVKALDPYIKEIFYTRVYTDTECDTFLNINFGRLVTTSPSRLENGLVYRYEHYTR